MFFLKYEKTTIKKEFLYLYYFKELNHSIRIDVKLYPQIKDDSKLLESMMENDS